MVACRTVSVIACCLLVIAACPTGPAVTFGVTYDANGGSGGTVPVDDSEYPPGQTVTVLGNTGFLVKEGHVFAGWNTEADGSGTSYDPGDAFAIGEDVTLYAQWSALPPTYQVAYDGNHNTGGTVPVDSADYEHGQTVTVMANAGLLVRTGHTFAGWNTEADGSGTSYDPGDAFVVSADVTLYAVWTRNASTFLVLYDGNGNTSGEAPVDYGAYADGQSATVLGNTGSLAKAGMEFAGWNTLAGGSGTAYGEGDELVMGPADVTLYAQWMEPAPTYRVYYNANGADTGSAPVDPISYTQGQPVTVLDNTGGLAGEGVLFLCWNDAPNGSGTDYYPRTEFLMGTADVTLYAKLSTIALGSPGPGGGLVFYDKGSYTGGWRYMEAANKYGGEFSDVEWGISPLFVSGTSVEMETGEQNTALILAAHGTHASAARLCADLVMNGKDDWFLPSAAELRYMNWNLHRLGLGDFAHEENYWSSSDSTATAAYRLYFSGLNVTEFATAKTSLLRVRAVRKF